MLDRVLRRDEPAHRLPDEAKLTELQRVEELDVVKDVVVDLVDGGVIGRGAEARMIGNHDSKSVAPSEREIEPRHGSCAVLSKRGVGPHRLEHDRADSVDL